MEIILVAILHSLAVFWWLNCGWVLMVKSLVTAWCIFKRNVMVLILCRNLFHSNSLTVVSCSLKDWVLWIFPIWWILCIDLMVFTPYGLHFMKRLFPLQISFVSLRLNSFPDARISFISFWFSVLFLWALCYSYSYRIPSVIL